MTFAPKQPLSGYSPTNKTQTQPTTLITSGQIGLWFAPSLPIEPRTEHYEPIVLPFAPARNQPTLFTTYGLAIAKNVNDPTSCWRWLRFLSDHPIPILGTFPARTSIATADSFLAIAPPGTKTAYDAYTPILNMPPAYWGEPDWYGVWELDSFWFLRAIAQSMQGAELRQELQRAQTLTEEYQICLDQGKPASSCAREIDPNYAGFTSQ